MNGWGFLLWLASITAVFSVPLVLFAGLMRLVGRIGPRGLASVVAVDAFLWTLAVSWYGLPGG